MKRNLIYFINPISGTRNKKDLIELISVETKNNNTPFQILNTNKEGDYSFLPTKITSENISDVIICGGDGTVSQITSFLLNTSVNIGIIPMGSGNGLALAARIPKNIRKALKIIFEGKSNYIDGFYINDKFGCMLAGLGFDAQVAHDFSTQKKRGFYTYILLSIRNFFAAKAYPFRVEVNHQQMKTDALFISIANSNQFGNHVTIAPMASLNDGLLDIVVVTKMNKLLAMFSLLRQISIGKILPKEQLVTKNKSILYFHTDELIIDNPKEAPLHLDGEPIPTEKRIKVRVLRNAFKLLQPA